MSIENKWHILIVFNGHQEDWISDNYETITTKNMDDGTCVMEGTLLDISQVYGLILQLRDLNMSFIEFHSSWGD